jgi:hypothetical protein
MAQNTQDEEVLSDLLLAILVGRRSQSYKESKSFVVLGECKEVFKSVYKLGAKHANVFLCETAVQSFSFRIVEIQVNQQRLVRIQSWLLNQVHRPISLYEEIVVHQVEKLGIVVVRYKPSATTRHSSDTRFILLTVAPLRQEIRQRVPLQREKSTHPVC